MSRLNYPHAKLSFETPTGFRPVAAAGYLWCGRSTTGERVTVQLWKQGTGLTELKPRSAALVYAHLHRKLPGKTFLRGPEEGMQVGGAVASFSGIERLQWGRPVRSYQLLALFDGNLYLFEYAAPMPRAEKGVAAFAKMLDTVHWAGMPPAPKVATTPSPKPAEKAASGGALKQTLSEKLGLPYLPASRATTTKAGGVLNSGL